MAPFTPADLVTEPQLSPQVYGLPMRFHPAPEPPAATLELYSKEWVWLVSGVPVTENVPADVKKPPLPTGAKKPTPGEDTVGVVFQAPEDAL